jgi:hypothetical protein
MRVLNWQIDPIDVLLKSIKGSIHLRVRLRDIGIARLLLRLRLLEWWNRR